MLPETVPVEIRHDGGAKKAPIGRALHFPRGLEKNRTNLANGFYTNGSDEVGANFSDWKNLSLVEETIRKACRKFGPRRYRTCIST